MTIGQKLKLDNFYVTRLSQMFIKNSILRQQKLPSLNLNRQVERTTRISFLGPQGSYSHLATQQYSTRYFNQVVEYSCHTFADILQLLETGQTEYGILPIENSSSGSINEVYDLLQHMHLSLVGEISIPIDHCVLVSGNSLLERIEVIYSHPQPFQQCSQFITRFPKWKIQYCESTSAAMETVAQLNCPVVAALGSGQGGRLYGLQILEHNLANQQKNITRFIVLAKKHINFNEKIPSKTMLIITTTQQSGALIKALLVLRTYGIVMTRLKSRPIHGNPKEEMFFIDLQTHLRNLQMQKALRELQKVTCSLRVLGCYPSDNIAPIENSED